MTVPANLIAWIELACSLAVAATALVVLTGLADKRIRSGVGKRTAWQVCTLAVAIFLLGELFGVLPGVSGWTCAMLFQPVRSAVHTQPTPAPSLAARPLSESAAALPGLAGSSDAVTQPTEMQFSTTEISSLPTMSMEHVDSSGLSTDAPKLSSAAAHAASLPSGSGAKPIASVPTTTPARWPGVIWLIGFVLVVGRILAGRVALFAFSRARTRIPNQSCVTRVRELANRLGVRRNIRLIESDTLQGPIAFGILRPTIGLPAEFHSEFDSARQEAMLSHELAHLSAHDPAWHLLSDVLAALLWWHPAVWCSRQALRSASEFAADEASLVFEDGPDTLAVCLVELGARLARSRPSACAPIEGSGLQSSLGRRVERLINLPNRTWQPPSVRVSFMARFIGPVVMVAIAVLSTAWSHSPELSKGASMSKSIYKSWQQSLAAAALVTVFGSSDVAVHANEPVAILRVRDDENQSKEDKSQKQKIEPVLDSELEAKRRTIAKRIEELRSAGDEAAADKLAAVLKELNYRDAAEARLKVAKQSAEQNELAARLKQLEAENSALRAALQEKAAVEKSRLASDDREAVSRKKFVEQANKSHEEAKAKLELAEKAASDAQLEAAKRGHEQQARKSDRNTTHSDGIPSPEFIQKIVAWSLELSKLHAEGRHEEARELEKQIEQAAQAWGQRWKQAGQEWGKQWELWGKQLADSTWPAPRVASPKPNNDRVTPRVDDELSQLIRELRGELDRLRGEVAELRDAVKDRNEAKNREIKK